MTDEAKITREEMVEMFGDEMPIEAVNLLWNSDGSKTVGQVRAELRAIAARSTPSPIEAPGTSEVSGERLREMLAGCEGVTPGPWMLTGYGISAAGSTDTYAGPVWGEIARASDTILKDDDGRTWQCWGDKGQNAAHLARLDPQTVASIIRELLSARTSTAPVAEVTNPERLELHKRLLGALADARRNNSGYLPGMLLSRRDAAVVAEALLDRAIDLERASPPVRVTEDAIENAARALFRFDYPEDKWERFGQKDYHPERYRAKAKAALTASIPDSGEGEPWAWLYESVSDGKPMFTLLMTERTEGLNAYDPVKYPNSKPLVLVSPPLPLPE